MADPLRTILSPPTRKPEEPGQPQQEFSRTSNYGSQLSNPRAIELLAPTIKVEQDRAAADEEQSRINRSNAARRASQSDLHQKAVQKAMAEAQEAGKKRQVDAFDRYAKRIGRPYRTSYDGTPEWIDSDDAWKQQRQGKFESALESKRSKRRTESERAEREKSQYYNDRLGRLEEKRDQHETLPDYKRSEYETKAEKHRREMLESVTYAERSKLEKQAQELEGIPGFREPTPAAKAAQERLAKIDAGEETFDDSAIDNYAGDNMVIDPDQYAEFKGFRDQLAIDQDAKGKRDAIQAQIDRVRQEFDPDPTQSILDTKLGEVQLTQSKLKETEEAIKAEEALLEERHQIQQAKIEEDYRNALANGVTGDQLSQLQTWRTNASLQAHADKLEAFEKLEDAFQDLTLDQEDLEKKALEYERDRKLLMAGDATNEEDRQAAEGDAAQAQKKTEVLGEPTYKVELPPEARIPDEEVEGRIQEIEAINEEIRQKAIEAITPIREDTRALKQTPEEADVKIKETLEKVVQDSQEKSEKSIGIASEAITDFNAGKISDIQLNKITQAAGIPMKGTEVAAQAETREKQFEAAYNEIAEFNTGEHEVFQWKNKWTKRIIGSPKTTAEGFPKWRKDFVIAPIEDDRFVKEGVSLENFADFAATLRWLPYRENPFDIGGRTLGKDATSEDAIFPRMEDGKLKYPLRWYEAAMEKKGEYREAMGEWKRREEAQLAKYPDLSDEDREYILDKAHLDGAVRQIQDIGDVWQQLQSDPERIMPFVAGVAELQELLPIYDAAQRVQKAEEQGIPAEQVVSQSELQRLENFATMMSQEKTTGAFMLSLVETAIPYASEFYMSGGMYTAGKKITEKTAGTAMRWFVERQAKKKIKSTAVKKAIGYRAAYQVSKALRYGGSRLAGSVLQVPGAMATRIPGLIIREDMPEIQMSENDIGELQVISVLDDHTFDESVIRGLGRAWIEVVSERTGDYFRLPKKWRSALEKKAWFAAAKKANPLLANEAVLKVMKRAGFHGGFNEYLEEEVANVMSTVILGDKFNVPTLTDVAAQVAGFTIFGQGLQGVSRGILEAKLAPAKREISRNQRQIDLVQKAGQDPAAAAKLLRNSGVRAPDGSPIQLSPGAIKLVGNVGDTPIVTHLQDQVATIDKFIEKAAENHDDKAHQSLLETKGKMLAEINQIQTLYLAYGSHASDAIDSAFAQAQTSGNPIQIDAAYRAKGIAKILAGRSIDDLEPAERDAIEQGSIIAWTPQSMQGQDILEPQPIYKPAYEMVGATAIPTSEGINELNGISQVPEWIKQISDSTKQEAKKKATEAGAGTPGEAPGTEAPGTEAPGTEAPGTEAPGTEAPGTETPGADAGTEAPGAPDATEIPEDQRPTEIHTRAPKSQEQPVDPSTFDQAQATRATELAKFLSSKGIENAEAIAQREVATNGAKGDDYRDQGYELLDKIKSGAKPGKEKPEGSGETSQEKTPEAETKDTADQAEKTDKKAKQKAKADAQRTKDKERTKSVEKAIDAGTKKFKGALERLGLSIRLFRNQGDYLTGKASLSDFGGVYSDDMSEIGISLPGVLAVANKNGLEGDALDAYIQATIEEEIIHGAVSRAIRAIMAESGKSQDAILDEIYAEFREENPELAALIEKRIYPDLKRAKDEMTQLAKLKATTDDPQVLQAIQNKIDKIASELSYSYVHETTRILLQYRLGKAGLVAGVTEGKWRQDGDKYEKEIARILGDSDVKAGPAIARFLDKLIQAIRAMLNNSTPLSESQSGRNLEALIARGQQILEDHQAYQEAQAAGEAAENEDQRTEDFEDLTPVKDKDEAERRWSDGHAVYAVNEQDGTLIPIKSKEMLAGYTADQLFYDPGISDADTSSSPEPSAVPQSLETPGADNAPPIPATGTPPIPATDIGAKDGPPNSRYTWADIEILREQARKDTNTSPTQEQIEANNYKKGRFPWRSLQIAIENPNGSTRSGTDKKGEAWSVTMPADYGDLSLSTGADGDNIDVYVGDNLASERVFVINQKHGNRHFDEHKVFIGFDSMEEVEATYTAAFSKGSVPFHQIEATTIDHLVPWLKEPGHKTKPFKDPNAPIIPQGAKIYGPALADITPAGKYKNWEKETVPFRDFRDAKNPVYLEDGSNFFFRNGKIFFRKDLKGQHRPLGELELETVRKIATLRASKFNTDTSRTRKAHYAQMGTIGDIIEKLPGKILTKTEAQKLKGGDYWKANSSEYDGYPDGGFPIFYGPMIVSSDGSLPDEIASQLGMTVDEMWTAIIDAVAARMDKDKAGNDPEAKSLSIYEQAEQQYLEYLDNFARDTSSTSPPTEEGNVPIPRYPFKVDPNLRIGTRLVLDNGTIEVTDYDEFDDVFTTKQVRVPTETGSYTHAYGDVNTLEPGKFYFVRKVLPPQGADPYSSTRPALFSKVKFQSVDLEITNANTLGAHQFRKTLIAVHNTSEAGLRFIRESQSRLAYPSLAIVPFYQGLGGYGPITLITRSEVIDPKNKHSHVFPADAWTPRAPRAYYKVNQSAIRKWDSKTWDVTRPYFDRKRIAEDDSYGLFAKDFGPDNLSTSGTMVDGRAEYSDKLSTSLRMQIAFLLENGIKVPIPTKNTRAKYSQHAEEASPEIKQRFEASRPFIEDAFHRITASKWEDFNQEELTILVNLYRDTIDDFWSRAGEDQDDPGIFAEIATREKRFARIEDGKAEFKQEWRNQFIESLYWNWNGPRKVIDTQAIEDWVNNRFRKEELEQAFKAWIDDAVVEMLTDPHYMVGKRRVPATFENLLRHFATREINADIEEIGLHLSVSGARSSTLKKFTSIEQIKRAKGRLWTEEQFGKFRDAIGTETLDLAEALTQEVYTDKTQMFLEAIVDYFKKHGGATRGGLVKAFTDAGFSRDSVGDHLDRIERYIQILQEGPTTYFEAKLARSVELSEFAVAIVPKGTDPSLKKWLRKAGLKVRVYEGRDQRENRTLESARANKLLFASTRDQGLDAYPSILRRKDPKPRKATPTTQLLASTKGNDRDLFEARDPRGAQMIYFRSGVNADARLEEIQAANTHFGSSLADFRDSFYESIPNYLNNSSAAAMIDSGAVQVFRDKMNGKDAELDVESVMASYLRLAKAVQPDARNRLFVTAPDAIGDADLTRQYQEDHKEEILELINLGVQVIIPIQDQAKNLTDSWQEIAERVNLRPFVLGIPSTHESFDLDRVFTELDPDLLGPTGPRVSIHFLGLGINNRRTKKLVDRINALPEDHPLKLAKIRLDSNWRRSQVGNNPPRALTIESATELEAAAFYATREEGEFDETEWWSYLREGGFEMTTVEAEAFAHAFKVSAEEAKAAAAKGGLARMMETASRGMEDLEFHMVREFLVRIAKTSERIQRMSQVAAFTEVVQREANRHKDQGLELKPASAMDLGELFAGPGVILTDADIDEEKARLAEQEERRRQAKEVEERKAAKLEAPDLEGPDLFHNQGEGQMDLFSRISQTSTLPAWNAKDGYGEHDWTKEAWPEAMRESKMPLRRRGFLGFVQGRKIKGNWFSDVNTIDHSDVEGQDARQDSKFRYFPYHNGGTVVWNAEPDPQALAEVEGWLLEKKFPVRKIDGNWGNVPLMASTSNAPGASTVRYADARLEQLKKDQARESGPYKNIFNDQIRDWENIRAAAVRAGQGRPKLPEEIDGEGLTWGGRMLPLPMTDAETYMVSAFQVGDITGTPVDLGRQMSFADAIYFAEILKAGDFRRLSARLEDDVRNELEIYRTHELQQKIRKILDEHTERFPAIRIAMRIASGDLASDGEIAEDQYFLQDAVERIKAKDAMFLLQQVDYPGRAGLTSKAKIGKAVSSLYLEELEEIRPLLERVEPEAQTPETYEQMDLLASTLYHGSFNDAWDLESAEEFTGLGLHVGTVQAARDRSIEKMFENIIEEFSVEQIDGAWYVLDRDRMLVNDRGIEVDDIEQAQAYETEKEAQSRKRELAWETVYAFTDTGQETGWNIHELDVKIDNPYRLPDMGDWTPDQLIQSMKKDGIIEDYHKVREMLDKRFDIAGQQDWIRQKLEKAGYDGIVYKNEMEDPGKDSFIVFRRKQATRIQDASDLHASTSKPSAIEEIYGDINPDLFAAALPFQGEVTKQFLEETFIGRGDRFWGITNTDEGAVFGAEGRERSAMECTGFACAIWSKLPTGRAQWFGFYTEDNPTAKEMAKITDGHDFAVVDGRWIVDPWIVDVEGVSPRGVFDLEHGPDKAAITKWYGDRSKWTNMTGELEPAQGPPAQIQPTNEMIENRGLIEFFGPWNTKPDKASKIVDSAGRPLIVFRGDKRLDLIEKNGGFQMLEEEHGGSGAFYFTSEPEIASGYTSKDYGHWDAWEDHVAVRRTADQSFWQLSDLKNKWTRQELARIDAIVPTIATEAYDENDNWTEGPLIEPDNAAISASHWAEQKRRSRGNVWDAFIEVMFVSGTFENSDLGKLLELAGLVDSHIYTEDLTRPGISMVFLNIRSPFETNNADHIARVRAKYESMDIEVPYSITQLENAIENENIRGPLTYFTEKDREVFQAAGFDGVIDYYAGGNMGTAGSHTVYITFEGDQIRPAFTKDARDNPDLYASFTLDDVDTDNAAIYDKLIESPWLESKAYQMIEEKMPRKGMMPGKQIMGILMKNGVRKEEIEDLELDRFLKRGGTRFSRAQVQAFIKFSIPRLRAMPSIGDNGESGALNWSNTEPNEPDDSDIEYAVEQWAEDAWREDEDMEEFAEWYQQNFELDGFEEWFREDQGLEEDEEADGYDDSDVARWLIDKQPHDLDDYTRFLKDSGAWEQRERIEYDSASEDAGYRIQEYDYGYEIRTERGTTSWELTDPDGVHLGTYQDEEDAQAAAELNAIENGLIAGGAGMYATYVNYGERDTYSEIIFEFRRGSVDVDEIARDLYPEKMEAARKPQLQAQYITEAEKIEAMISRLRNKAFSEGTAPEKITILLERSDVLRKDANALREEAAHLARKYIAIDDALDRNEYHTVLRLSNRNAAYRNQGYTRTHWSKNPDAAFHVRFDVRDEIKRGGIGSEQWMIIQEVQSDMHTSGRQSAYLGLNEVARLQSLRAKALMALRPWMNRNVTTPLDSNDSLTSQQVQTMKSIAAGEFQITRPEDPFPTTLWNRYLKIHDRLEEANKNSGLAVLDFPWKQNWSEKAMWWAMKYAASKGYDGVAWASGADQIDLYADKMRQNVTRIDAILEPTITKPDFGKMVDERLAEWVERQKPFATNFMEIVYAPIAKAALTESAFEWAVKNSERTTIWTELEEDEAPEVAKLDAIIDRIDWGRVAEIVAKNVAERLANNENEEAFEDTIYFAEKIVKNAITYEIGNIVTDIIETGDPAIKYDPTYLWANSLHQSLQHIKDTEAFYTPNNIVAVNDARSRFHREGSAIRETLEKNPYAGVTVTMGELIKDISKKRNNSKVSPSESRSVRIIAYGPGSDTPVFNNDIPLEGTTTIQGRVANLERVTGSKIANEIREAAKDIPMSGNWENKWEGDRLSIGGHMHRMIYDTILPKTAKNLSKKFKFGQPGPVTLAELDTSTTQETNMKNAAVEGRAKEISPRLAMLAFARPGDGHPGLMLFQTQLVINENNIETEIVPAFVSGFRSDPYEKIKDVVANVDIMLKTGLLNEKPGPEYAHRPGYLHGELGSRNRPEVPYYDMEVEDGRILNIFTRPRKHPKMVDYATEFILYQEKRLYGPEKATGTPGQIRRANEDAVVKEKGNRIKADPYFKTMVDNSIINAAGKIYGNDVMGEWIRDTYGQETFDELSSRNFANNRAFRTYVATLDMNDPKSVSRYLTNRVGRKFLYEFKLAPRKNFQVTIQGIRFDAESRENVRKGTIPLYASTNSQVNRHPGSWWRFVENKGNDAAVAAVKTIANVAKYGSRKTGLTKIVQALSNTSGAEWAKGAGKWIQGQVAPATVLPREAAAIINEARGSIVLANEIGKDLARVLQGGGDHRLMDFHVDPRLNTPENHKLLSLYFRGKIPIDRIKDPELLKLAGKVKKLWDDRGLKLVKAGLMTQETYDDRRANYFPHMFYEKEQEKYGIQSVGKKLRMGLDRVRPQLATAWYIYEIDQNNKPLLDERGGLKLLKHDGKKWRFDSAQHRDQWFETFVNREIVKELHQAGRSTFTLRDLTRLEQAGADVQALVAAAKMRIGRAFAKGKPKSEDDLEKMGLITNLAYVVPRSTIQMDVDIILAKMLTGVANRSEWISKNPVDGFTHIPDNPRYGELADLYVNKEIAREIEGFIETPELITELYDGGLRIWKKWKTVYNPGTHFRNVIGNTMFADLAEVNWMNPENWKYYWRIRATLKNKNPDVDLQELFEEGILGGDFSRAELEQIANELPGPPAGNEDSPVTEHIFRGPSRWVRKMLKKGDQGVTALYRMEDELFKVAAYLAARDRGMTKTEAGNHVRQWFPFYDRIGNSGLITFARRFPMPFLSFMHEAWRIAFLAMRYKPLTFAKWMSLPSLVTLYSAIAMGLDDDDLEAIAKDMRGKVGDWPMFSMLLPWKDKEGRPAQWDLSNVIPYADAIGKRIDRGDDNPPFYQEMIQKYALGGPLTQLAFAWGMGIDPFSGRKFKQTGMTEGEVALEQAKYSAALILPPWTPFFGTSDPVRVFMDEFRLGSMKFGSPEAKGQFLTKRNRRQEAIRSYMGLDIRTASPSPWRMVEDFRKEQMLPPSPEFSDTTFESRARRDLYTAIVNDNINEIAYNLTVLRDQVKEPVNSRVDVNRLLFRRNPLHALPRDQQMKFLASLSPIERETVQKAVAEFKQVENKAWRLITQAKAQMPPPSLTGLKPVK